MNHGSLFSGVGGFDLAAQWMGWNNVFHCEYEAYKRDCLHKNFPESIGYGDIQTIDFNPHKDQIDILTGGFPCQDISIANQSKKTNGARGINGERSGLWKHYSRAVGEIRPKFIVFENSPMLLVRGLEQVLFDLHELGYDVEWRLFYATQFGFPHLRERIYGVAYSRELGWQDYLKKGGIIQKILPERTPRQKPVSIPIKRFKRESSYEDVRMDDGFSQELDKTVIHGFGNAIVPHVALEIFKAIESYEIQHGRNHTLPHQAEN